MRSFFAFLLIGFFSFVLNAATCATDICVLPAGGSVKIDKFSLCNNFASTLTKDVMIPTKTQAEYQSFIDRYASITGVSQSACTAGTPTYIGLNYTTTSGGTSTHNAFPAGTAAGDFVLLLITDTNSLATVTPPAGVTTAYANFTADGFVRKSIFYKILTATDITNGQFTFTRTGNFGAVVGNYTHVFRSVDPTTPVADKTQQIITVNGPITYLSCNVTTAGSLLVGWGGANTTTPTGFTNVQDDFGGVVSYKTAAGTGATGDFSGGTVNNGFANLFVLNPAP